VSVSVTVTVFAIHTCALFGDIVNFGKENVPAIPPYCPIITVLVLQLMVVAPDGLKTSLIVHEDVPMLTWVLLRVRSKRT
jgi:hypothetical protein